MIWTTWQWWHCYFTDHKPVETHSGHDCSARHLVAVIKRGDDRAEGAAEHPVPPTCPLVNKEWHDGHVHQVGHSQVSHIHIWYCLFGGPAKKIQERTCCDLWSLGEILLKKLPGNVRETWQVASSNKQGYISSTEWQCGSWLFPEGIYPPKLWKFSEEFL